jgi:hypothetical protein
MEIFRSNIWEIKKSGALKTLGGILALFHIAQFFFWNTEGRLPLKLVQQGLPMCWSFMEHCGWMQSIPFGILTFVYYAYVSFIGLAACVLLLTEWVAFGYWLLAIGSFFGLTLYFQDLRLSSNEGYLIFLLSLGYLLVPSKHRLMRRLVISFFVAHGLSEAASDWLSGVWYMDHLHLPVKLAEWLAAMSVVVQMIGSAAMLFRDGRYFWSGWLVLFFYTITHLYMGDMLSSSLSIGSLLYLAFDEIELRKAERQYIYQSFIRPEPSFFWGGVMLTIFWCAQLLPFASLPRESKVRKALSVWTLHPEAANEDCDQKTFAIYKNRVEEIDVTPQLSRQPAMFCNPYLRYLDLKGTCKILKESNEDFVTLSSVLNIRNFREKTSYRAFEVQDFCNPNLTYQHVGEVQWTMKPEK